MSNDTPSSAAKGKDRQKTNVEKFAKIFSTPPARPKSAEERKRAILRGS